MVLILALKEANETNNEVNGIKESEVMTTHFFFLFYKHKWIITVARLLVAEPTYDTYP